MRRGLDSAAARTIFTVMRRLIALALAAFLIVSPAAAQQAQDGDATAPIKDVQVEPVARDDQIAGRIARILEATGWFTGARVTVDDGVVFLDGVTDTEDHRTWARDLAAKTQDVVAVVNRIEVVSEADWSFAPAMDALSEVSDRLIRFLPLAVLALIVLPLTWWLSSLAARGMRRFILGRVESPFLRSVVARMLALPIFFIGLYIVLQTAGLTQLAFSVVGGAGVIGIIVGFAFRDIAENFLASLLLSIRQPFRSGDFIEVDGMQGTVRSMNTRSTVLISLDGNHIQIPNATVFKNTITNFTASPERRDQIAVGIGYDASISQAQTIIQRVLEDHEAVMTDPQPMVLVEALGSSTVNIVAYYWVDVGAYSLPKVRSAILRLIKKALMEAGISMPDEAREIVFPEGVPIITDRPGRPRVLPPPPPAAEESAAQQTVAEADLDSDEAEIAQRADRGDIPEDDGNLLN